MPFNIPILLTWLRVALIPLVVGVFYLPEHWLPAGRPEPGRHAGLHRRRGHRLVRRLPRAALEPDLGLRRLPRSGRRQADGGRRAAGAGAAGPRRRGASPSSSSAARSRSRRCANGWRRSARRKSVAVSSLGKIKTTAQMVAIPMLLFHGNLFGVIDTQLLGPVPAVGRGRADGVVDVLLPAPGVAADQGKRRHLI